MYITCVELQLHINGMMHNLQRYCFTPQTHQACRHVALCSLAAAQLHATTRDTIMLQPTRDRTHVVQYKLQCCYYALQLCGINSSTVKQGQQ